MSTISVISVSFLIILILIILITGITLAILQYKRDQAFTGFKIRPVILSETHTPQIINNDIITLQDEKFHIYMKPVFGCTQNGGHVVCVHDSVILDTPEKYQWRISVLNPIEGIVSLQNVSLGTYLTNEDNNIHVDSINDRNISTHWKLLYTPDGKLIIQSVSNNNFLVIKMLGPNRILGLSEYNFNQEDYGWKYQKITDNNNNNNYLANQASGRSCNQNSDCIDGLLCLAGRCKRV